MPLPASFGSAEIRSTRLRSAVRAFGRRSGGRRRRSCAADVTSSLQLGRATAPGARDPSSATCGRAPSPDYILSRTPGSGPARAASLLVRPSTRRSSSRFEIVRRLTQSPLSRAREHPHVPLPSTVIVPLPLISPLSSRCGPPAMSMWKWPMEYAELSPPGLVAFDFQQPRDVVPLQAAVQRRSGQVRDRRLQGAEAVIQRQQCEPAEGNDDPFLVDAQHRRMASLGPGRTSAVLLRHLATVLRLISWRLASALRLS